MNWWNQPLGEVLTFPTPTIEPTMTTISVQSTEKAPTTVSTPDPTPVSSPEPTELPEPVEDIRGFINSFEKDTITTDIGGGVGRLCP